MTEKELIIKILSDFIAIETAFPFIKQMDEQKWQDYVNAIDGKAVEAKEKGDEVYRLYARIALAITDFKEWNSKRAHQRKVAQNERN